MKFLVPSHDHLKEELDWGERKHTTSFLSSWDTDASCSARRSHQQRIAKMQHSKLHEGELDNLTSLIDAALSGKSCIGGSSIKGLKSKCNNLDTHVMHLRPRSIGGSKDEIGIWTTSTASTPAASLTVGRDFEMGGREQVKIPQARPDLSLQQKQALLLDKTMSRKELREYLALALAVSISQSVNKNPKASGGDAGLHERGDKHYSKGLHRESAVMLGLEENNQGEKFEDDEHRLWDDEDDDEGLTITDSLFTPEMDEDFKTDESLLHIDEKNLRHEEIYHTLRETAILFTEPKADLKGKKKLERPKTKFSSAQKTCRVTKRESILEVPSEDEELEPITTAPAPLHNRIRRPVSLPKETKCLPVTTGSQAEACTKTAPASLGRARCVSDWAMEASECMMASQGSRRRFSMVSHGSDRTLLLSCSEADFMTGLIG